MTDARQLERFLESLEETLRDLQGIQHQRENALRGMNTDELASLADAEGECALRARRALSCQSDEADNDDAISSLRQCFDQLAEPDRLRLQGRLESVRRQAGIVRDHLAANWLVTYRMNQHVQGMLEILSCDDGELGETDEGAGLYLDHRA